jgi:shikimate dehydrogenase
MHEAAFAALGIDAHYELREASTDEAATVVDEVRAGRWRGANVTTPLKTHVAPLVALDPVAARCGAVNTLWWSGNVLRGDLTDVEGVRSPIIERVGASLSGVAVVLGAGGAARAACVALESLGAEVWVWARRPEAAASMLVQATPVGRSGERHALPWEALPRRAIAFEMLYAPRRTPFVESAAAAGAEVVFGWEMLVAQGAASFARWTGQAAPVDVMRAAVLEKLT